jgi:hypothetical protein
MSFHLKPGRARCADCKILYNLRWLVTLDRKRVCFPSCNFNASKLLKMEGETSDPVRKVGVSLLPNEVSNRDWTG